MDSWARLDEGGAITQVGFTLPLEAVRSIVDPAVVVIGFPVEVQTQTFLNHLRIDYNPNGHGSSAWSAAHFDFHFFALDTLEREEISCAAEPMPDASALPAPFFINSTAISPSGTCNPGMGVHAYDSGAPELDAMDPQPFVSTLVLGYHAGQLAFIEPMVTREALNNQHEFEFYIPRPASLDEQVNYPRRARGVWLADERVFEISLDRFEVGYDL